MRVNRIILCFATVFVLGAFASGGTTVYICVSKTASKYHYDRGCRGLKQCTHTIEAVSLEEAKQRGYGLCGFED